MPKPVQTDRRKAQATPEFAIVAGLNDPIRIGGRIVSYMTPRSLKVRAVLRMAQIYALYPNGNSKFSNPFSLSKANQIMGRENIRRKHGAIGLSKQQLKWIRPPKEGWAKLFINVMDGEPYRCLSVTERRILDALIHHHFTFRQRENGNLQISYSQFEAAGATRKLISTAIRKLVACKLIETTQGRAINNGMKRPSIYGLPIYAEAKGGDRFVWIHLDVLESPAWFNLSLKARRVMDRLLVENGNHRGEKNGELRVSYDQFEGHGVAHRLIRPALDELINAGMLAIAKGKGGGSRKPPNLYRITFFGTLNGPRTWRPRSDFEQCKIFPLGTKGDPGLGIKGSLEGANIDPEIRYALGA